MRNTKRQVLFGIALVTPLLWGVLVTSPFVAEPAAQGGGGMFGPLTPASAGGSFFYPTLKAGTTYKLNSPWSCPTGSLADEVTFGGGPPYTMATRSNHGVGQTVRTTRWSNGFPVEFSYTDTRGWTGTLVLSDVNSDGVYDTVVGNGTRSTSDAPSASATTANFTLALQLRDANSDGNPDRVSLPWAEVNSLGWLDPTDGCNDSEPQAWVPLADTNNDGKPDAIVLDLDGNGTADPQFYTSPTLVPTGVPSVNWSGLALLAVLLGSLACWTLARRQTLSEA